MSYHYTFETPSDEVDNDNESENSYSANRTNSSTLENPYDKRSRKAKVNKKQIDALKKWKRKVKLWSAVLILTSGFMIYSNIWYANVIGLAAGGIGIYGAAKEHSEFLFVYLVLLFLELLKNIGVFFVGGACCILSKIKQTDHTDPEHRYNTTQFV